MDYNTLMRSALTASLILFLFSAASVFSDDTRVGIYRDARAENLGRAADRRAVESFGLEDFRESSSLPAEPGGILTAVLVDLRVKDALGELLSDRNFIFIENSVISRKDGEDGIYRFNWNEYGFEIEFSLEKADRRLYELVDQTYRNNPYIAGEVRRSYSDNCIVRILAAEDFRPGSPGMIDFKEAMTAATVIGDVFQPLLGIHDGLGVLNGIGIISARIDLVTEGSLIEYRPLRKAETEIRSFIQSVSGMEGDFIENLYAVVSGTFGKQSGDDHIMLPEDFFLRRKGDNTDYALFYYDILKRTGYEVRLIVIDSGAADGSLYTTVFFREEGADLWGRIDGRALEREKAGRFGRMPSLVFSASVDYFEPDIEEIFDTGTISLPPPSKWNTSLY